MKLLVLILTLSFFGQVSFANKKCKSALKGNKFSVPIDQVAALDPTSNFIAYLENLLSAGILDSSHISEFSKKLSADKILNPFSLVPSNDLNQAPHIKEIDKQISTIALDIDALSIWAQEKSNEMKLSAVERGEVSAETAEIYHKIRMNPIRKGSFWSGQPEAIRAALQQVATGEVSLEHFMKEPANFQSINDYTSKPSYMTLLQDYMLSETLVTQNQWVEIMGENPSKFSEGVDEAFYGSSDTQNTVRMQPNHPVENISKLSAMVFLNKLSELHGLMPVYDFDKSTIFVGNPAMGELRIKERLEGEISINAPGGDVYKAEGFRLPTAAEWEFAARAGGKSIEAFPFDTSTIPVEKFAWLKSNSNGITHSVHSLLPIKIDGYEFSDLFGNVDEWIHDGWMFYSGENPQSDSVIGGVVKGGSYTSDPEGGLSAHRKLAQDSSFGDFKTGFRIARTPVPAINRETKEFINLHDELYSEGVLDLETLKKQLAVLRAEGKIKNPFEIAFVDKNNFIDSVEQINEQIDKGAIVELQFFKWLHGKIKLEEQRSFPALKLENLDAVSEEALFDKRKPTHIEFRKTHNLKEPGTAKLTKNIEVMAKPVTQALWLEIMSNDELSENPSTRRVGVKSRFVVPFKNNDFTNSEYTRYEVEILSRTNKPVLIDPDAPVETITWWSALVFANRMSEREGLPPVYDLSHINFRGSAELGNLRPNANTAERADYNYLAKKYRPKINSLNGDIYRAKGYRLPTDAEWEAYVLQKGLPLGQLFEWVHDRNSPPDSILLSEKKGILAERVASFFVNRNQKIRQGTNPQGHSGGLRHLLGDSANEDSPEIGNSNYRRNFYEGLNEVQVIDSDKGAVRSEHIGFRLVRTLSRKEAKQ